MACTTKKPKSDYICSKSEIKDYGKSIVFYDTCFFFRGERREFSIFGETRPMFFVCFPTVRVSKYSAMMLQLTKIDAVFISFCLFSTEFSFCYRRFTDYEQD